METIHCVECGKEITHTTRRDTKYCSAKCRQRAYVKRQAARTDLKGKP